MSLVQEAVAEPDMKLQAATPCGLGNLGATFDANGALQCLFMNLAFREGLFAVEPPVADDAIIGSLRSACHPCTLIIWQDEYFEALLCDASPQALPAHPALMYGVELKACFATCFLQTQKRGEGGGVHNLHKPFAHF